MIRVFVGYKIKQGANIEPVLSELRHYALTFRGYISCETLLSEIDNSLVTMITTWERVEDWNTWKASQIRQAIIKDVDKFLVEEPKVSVHRVLSATGWGLGSSKP